MTLRYVVRINIWETLKSFLANGQVKQEAITRSRVET